MEHTSYRLQDGERPSTAVVNAIADHEGTSPHEIGPRLYDAVDPDALDSLFRQRVDGGFEMVAKRCSGIVVTKSRTKATDGFESRTTRVRRPVRPEQPLQTSNQTSAVSLDSMAATYPERS